MLNQYRMGALVWRMRGVIALETLSMILWKRQFVL